MSQRSLYAYYANILRNATRHGKALGGMTPEMIAIETVARSAIDKLLRDGYVPPEKPEPKNELRGRVPQEIHDLIQRWAGDGLVFSGRQLAAARPEAITISAFLRCVYALRTTHSVYQASLDEMLEVFERTPIEPEEIIALRHLLLKLQERREAEITKFGRVSRKVARLSAPAFVVPFVAHNRKFLLSATFGDDGSWEEEEEMYDELLSDEVITQWIDEVGTDGEGKDALGIRRIGKKSLVWFKRKYA